jgi:hypothetical protein
MKPHYQVRLGEVRFVRNGEWLQVQYPEPDIPSYHFHLGPGLVNLTEQELVDIWNDHLRTMPSPTADYKQLAIEDPMGSPQAEAEAGSGQPVLRREVVRCAIHDNADNMPVIEIDGRKLSWEEFGKLIVTYAGWGMRIAFVPDDELHHEPETEVREPEDREIPGQKKNGPRQKN